MSAYDTLNAALYGNPPTPGWKPSRDGVLNAFNQILTQIASLTVGTQSYATVSALPSGAAVGSSARVYADPTSTNDTFWLKGSGGWAIDTYLLNSIASVVQPLVDEAAASANGAAAQATNAGNYANAAAASAATALAAGMIFTSASAGIAGSTNGKMFLVSPGSASTSAADLYLNASGTAVLQTTFPNQASIDVINLVLSSISMLTGDLFSNPFSISDNLGNDILQLSPSGLISIDRLAVITNFIIGKLSPSNVAPNAAISLPGLTVEVGLYNYSFVMEDSAGNVLFAITPPVGSTPGSVTIFGAGGGSSGGLILTNQIDGINELGVEPRRQITGTRGCFNRQLLSGSMIGGAGTGQNTRMQVSFPQGSTGVQLLFTSAGGVAEGQPAPNSFTFSCAIEYPAGTLYPLTFGGNSNFTLEPNLSVTTDMLDIDIPVGAVAFIRCYVSVASAGMQWTCADVCTALDGMTIGSSQSNQTLNASYSYTVQVGQNLFGPLAIIGRGNLKQSAVLITGDSIAQGEGDASMTDGGFFVRALNDAGIPWSSVAFYGETAGQWDTQISRLSRVAVARYTGNAVTDYGTNDFNFGANLLTTQTRCVAMWQTLWSRGAKVWATTLLPKVTSSDRFTTSSGQTPVTGFATGGIRSQFNAWLRGGAPINPTTFAPVAIGTAGALIAGTNPHPLKGYFEAADLVETSRDSGLWITNGRNVTDGAIASGALSTLTSATANFTSGDTGYTIAVAGAGVSGGVLTAVMTYVNPTTVTLSTPATAAVSGATANIRAFYPTLDGIHPTTALHIILKACIITSDFIW